MTKIVIHGAGSIGCFVGGVWASENLDVTLLGRASLVESVGNLGMTLTDGVNFKRHLAADHFKATDDPATLKNADLIVLAVKCTGSATAAQEITQHAQKGTPVLSLQNGISNVSQLEALLPNNPVIAGMVPFNVARLSDTHWHKGTKGDIISSPHGILSSIVSHSAGSPAALETTHDMQAVAWGKLLLNLNNALNALSGLTLKAELSDRSYRLVLAAAIREGLNALKAANITPAKVSAFPPQKLPGFVSMPNFIFNTIGLKLQKVDDKARSSMADDFAAGRQSEIDYLNAEIVKLSEEHGLSAPVNQKIVELVKNVDAGNTRRWSGAELYAEVFK